METSAWVLACHITRVGRAPTHLTTGSETHKTGQPTWVTGTAL